MNRRDFLVSATGMLFGSAWVQAESSEVTMRDAAHPSVSPAVVETWRAAEVTLTTDKRYANPFTDVTLDAIVTDPGGRQWRVPAFWAGEGQWRFRYTSGTVGTHRFRTVCSDHANPQLHDITGTISVIPYRGNNPLYRHGPVRVASDRRRFQYADGHPFFWLGDTWWKGLCKRISFQGFQELTADRAAKGFTLVQIVAGPYPDEPPFDPRWENEGGMPYDRDYHRVNPAYFDAADRRIQHLADSGIVPAIVGGWGWHMPSVGVEKFTRHWRYLIARYGAFPVIWIVAGEGGGDTWTQVARSVRNTDPFHHPITIHPYSSARQAVTDESVLDFDMLQTGHNDWGCAANTVAKLTSAYSKTPPMPVVIGEVAYEGHMMGNREDLQRFLFWTCMLNGAAGYTYGAGGIWQMNSETIRGAEYEFTTWAEARKLPGSAEIGRAKHLLDSYPWWRFDPHPEWIEPHGTTLLEPHAQWYDDNQSWAAHGGRYDLPYAAGIPGELRFIYIPGNHPYDWTAPSVTSLEPDTTYQAFFFDPVWGKRYNLGILVWPVAQGTRFRDDFNASGGITWKDYGTPSRREAGRLVGDKGMVTVAEAVVAADVMAAVGAQSDAEAGLIFRFHDADNYIVALYTPQLKAIYLHDRKNGQWGEPLGKVTVTQIGDRIRLTAAVCGEYAAMTITDGRQTFTTPTVKISNTAPGKAGLWHFQVGDTQAYDRFEMARARIDKGPVKPEGQALVLNENPGILPAVPAPDISLILNGAYCPPRLPSPQDWVLVLERRKTE